MAPRALVLCSALLLSLLDLFVSTLLFTKGFDVAVMSSSCVTFDPGRSVLDVWLWVWPRSSALLGACIGVMCNGREGPRRAAASLVAAVLVAMVTVTYALAKTLVLMEAGHDDGGAEPGPWEYSLIGWSCCAAVLFALMWSQLRHAHDQFAPPVVAEDTERLLDPPRGQSEFKVPGQDQTSPDPDPEPNQTQSGASLGRLLWYCREDASLLTIATLFLLIYAVCEAFIPHFYGEAIDNIVNNQSMEHLSTPVLKLAALAFSSSLAMTVRGGVFTLVCARLNLHLRKNLFNNFMKQEIAFYDHNHTGDLLSRLSADTTQISDLVSTNVNILLRSLVKAVGFSIFMFSISSKLTVVTLMGLPYIALSSHLYGEYYKKLSKLVQSTLAEANRVAEEVLSSMTTVRSFANESNEAESYHEKLLHMFAINKKQAVAYGAYVWSSSFSTVALEVAVLYYGGHLVVSGQITSGALIAFFIYMLQLGECLEEVASVYTGLMQGVGAAEKVFEYLDREPTHSSAEGLEEPQTCSGLVEFRDVTFAYPTRPTTDVLKGVSFTLQPGKVTALVGPSGGGKSSCVSLLENFYPPQSGQVLLDGRPVNTLTQKYLHSQVALVGQEPVLFARSVEENIVYGLECPPEGAMERAATQANAHEFICELQHGYKTSVGEKGAQLSGGQKQRVAIARALVRNPRVLILDEATSALDAHSEHIVQQALVSAMEDRTVLVIAHRLSSVEKADHIVVIHQGGVAEQGTHSDLMELRGLYHRLVQRQVQGAELHLDHARDQNSEQRPERAAQGGVARSHDSDDEFITPRF